MFRTLTLGASALAILATPLAASAQDNRDGTYVGSDGQVHQRGDRDGRDNRDNRDRDGRGYNGEIRDDRRDVRDERRDLRDARDNGDRRDIRDERGDLRQAQGDLNRDRQDRRDWRRYRNYDYNRPAPGQNAYYADQYYRDGRYYQPRRLGANDRIYRGQDNRYYCRRQDGTTGLIVGGLTGGVLGNVIAPGGSKGLGTVLGGLGGALLGRSVDRNNVTCR